MKKSGAGEVQRPSGRFREENADTPSTRASKLVDRGALLAHFATDQVDGKARVFVFVQRYSARMFRACGRATGRDG